MSGIRRKFDEGLRRPFTMCDSSGRKAGNAMFAFIGYVCGPIAPTLAAQLFVRFPADDPIV